MVQQIEAKVLYRPPLEELRFLPEGPYPCGAGEFSWVAIQHGPDQVVGSLNHYHFGTGHNQSYTLPGRPGFAFPTDVANRFVIGCDRELGIYDLRDGSWTLLESGIDQRVEGTIINDGITWDGNIVFGCKDLQFKEAKAGLYLWRGRDQKLILLRDDQICSNGKVIQKIDANTVLLWDIDTPTKTVVRYRLDLVTGRLSERSVALDLVDLPFFPDGMVGTPDGEGVIISFYNPHAAAYGETRLYRLSDGAHVQTWITPGSPQATCPMLIEEGGSVKMVITTAVEHMPQERRADSPNAGSLFVAETDFKRASDAPLFLESNESR